MASLAEGTWSVEGNGYRGELVIQGVDAQGRVSGTIYGQQISGWWDEAAGRLTFLRMGDPADPTSYQAWDGYQWDDLNPQPGENKRSHLAGSFETFAGAGGTAQRPTYGWYAEIEISG